MRIIWLILNDTDSLTGKYLSGAKKIPVPKTRRKPKLNQYLTVVGARENNLKNLTIKFPLGVMTVVSGVSGSGKSTLVNEILANELLARLHRAQTVAGEHERIDGIDNLDKCIVIDQSPIGRTPRSNQRQKFVVIRPAVSPSMSKVVAVRPVRVTV